MLESEEEWNVKASFLLFIFLSCIFLSISFTVQLCFQLLESGFVCLDLRDQSPGLGCISGKPDWADLSWASALVCNSFAAARSF